MAVLGSTGVAFDLNWRQILRIRLSCAGLACALYSERRSSLEHGRRDLPGTRSIERCARGDGVSVFENCADYDCPPRLDCPTDLAFDYDRSLLIPISFATDQTLVVTSRLYVLTRPNIAGRQTQNPKTTSRTGSILLTSYRPCTSLPSYFPFSSPPPLSPPPDWLAGTVQGGMSCTHRPTSTRSAVKGVLMLKSARPSLRL